MEATNAIRRLLRLAIDEDLGGGDPTSELTVPAGQRARGLLLAKESLVMCGGPLAELLFAELQWPVAVQLKTAEGEAAAAGTVLGSVEGQARHLLSAERTLLNFLQRLCGIATRARTLVEQAAGLTVLDTRKTTPGWRALEKYAVRVGGARNHRGCLADMILVKDNHIDAHGGDVRAALRHVMAHKGFYVPVEVEVRSLAELEAAVECGVQLVLLDNMDDSLLGACLDFLRRRAPHVLTEVSGRVRPERFARLAELGISSISTSAMVTDAVWVDISMKLERC